MKALLITVCVAFVMGAALKTYLKFEDLNEKISAQSVVIYGLFEQLKAAGVIKEEKHEN